MAKKPGVDPAAAKDAQDKKVEDYNKVVAAAELGSIQLVKLEFDVSPEFYVQKEEVELGYVITPESVEYSQEDDLAICVIQFEVTGSLGNENLLRCVATYMVMYLLEERCDEDAVKAFLRRVGVFASYPYFRSVFASLDWAANTRLPPLPVHKEEVKRVPKPKSRKRTSKSVGSDA